VSHWPTGNFRLANGLGTVKKVIQIGFFTERGYQNRYNRAFSRLQSNDSVLYFKWKQLCAWSPRSLSPFVMATQLSRKRAPEAPTIPDRLYFKIGDVARICEVETYVLRFWESQFPQLKPNKSGTGQRLYRRRDVELALDIKRLVHGEGYTIAGARQALDQSGHRREPQLKIASSNPEQAKVRESVTAAIGRARAELREILGLLAVPAVASPVVRRRTKVAQFAVSGSLFPS
jgi:DNA-binding transcriptional MerR regulator